MSELSAYFQDEQLLFKGQGTGGSTNNDEKAIWCQIMDELDSNGTNEICYEEFRDSLFSVLQKNIDESGTIMFRASQRASICFDVE